MWRYGIGLAALLLVADARAEDLCMGMPAAQVTAAMGLGRATIDGRFHIRSKSTSPVSHKIGTCGGGVSVNGEQIEPWRCFIQAWDVKLNGASATVVLAFDDDAGDGWRLNGGRIRFNATGNAVDVPFKPCTAAPEPTSPTAKEEI